MIQRYSAIIFATGAEGNRNLNIPGENLKGVYSARDFVNWYNGHPDSAQLEKELDLQKIKNVIIIGQGNVALDCARILVKQTIELEPTDITTQAIHKLQLSNVEHVTLIGRRGYGQIACTIKELRELTKLTGVQVKIDQSEIEKGINEATKQEINEKRPLKRLTDLLLEISQQSADMSMSLSASNLPLNSEENLTKNKKVIEFKFLLSPKEIKGNSDQTIREIDFERCQLVGLPNQQSAQPLPTPNLLTLPCDLLLSSIGYKSIPISSEIPFDYHTHTIPHQQGRVIGKDGKLLGIYTTGWCKRGPTGIIGTNITDAKETVQSVLTDLKDNQLKVIPSEQISEINSFLLNCKGNKSYEKLSRITTWVDALQLDKYEKEIGSKKNPSKIREKCITIEDMMTAIDSQGIENS